jgi:hypothetical protein
MSLLRRCTAALVAVLAFAGLTAVPAHAITGGEPDGNQHPNVALIVFYAADGRFRCSATLVSPTVLVTAAHCTDGTLGKTVVTFASTIAEEAPSGLPVAADPARGYTGREKVPAGYTFGTAATHPRYSDFTDTANWNDVGVVVLDKAVSGLPTSSVAPLRYLDAYAPPALSSTLFTVVGYGTEVRKPEFGPQKPQPMTFPLIRRNTTSPGQKLDPQLLQLSGNPADTRGGGGTCFGDSGGPVFLDGRLVAVTSYGYTDNCRYLGGYQRLDIPVVQDWLARYGVRAGA